MMIPERYSRQALVAGIGEAGQEAMPQRIEDLNKRTRNV
jgi:molybdopterin/thiamine biosynthesis adenylyltransferase